MSQPDGPAASVEAGSWTVERLHGSVSDLLEAAEPSRGSPRVARLHIVDRPGLVLGSTQRLKTADHVRAAAAGTEVVRRRSGGGAVLLSPGRQVWVDFFVSAQDLLWSDDVTHAALWVGELWSAVIEPFVTEPISVHSGRLVADKWGQLVCFAGAGPGEVFVGGLKVVGVSQRRSRDRARIQTTARLRHPSAAGGCESAGSITTGCLIDPELRPSAAGGCESAGSSLDELELLDVTPADRSAGRAVMSGRRSSIPAVEADLAEALVRALQDPL